MFQRQCLHAVPEIMITDFTGKRDHRAVFIALCQPWIFFPTLNGAGPTTIRVSAISASGYRWEEGHFITCVEGMVEAHQRLVDGRQQLAIF